MKTFSIIIDENKQKQVIPTLWLTTDKKYIKWPSTSKKDELKKKILTAEKPQDDWKTYEITKFIKSYDSYNAAIEDSKLADIEKLSEVSDDDAWRNKVKNSRAERKKIRYTDFVNAKDKKATKKSKQDNKENEPDDSESSRSNVSSENDREMPESIVPETMNVCRPQNDSPNRTTPPNPSTTEPLPNTNDNSADLSDKRIEGALKLLLTQQNVIVKRIEKIEKILDNIKSSMGASSSNVTLNPLVLNVVDSYYPIDAEEENTSKKVESVEAKLKRDSTFVENTITVFMQLYL